jgi:hypothetical protein
MSESNDLLMQRNGEIDAIRRSVVPYTSDSMPLVPFPRWSYESCIMCRLVIPGVLNPLRASRQLEHKLPRDTTWSADDDASCVVTPRLVLDATRRDDGTPVPGRGA